MDNPYLNLSIGIAGFFCFFLYTSHAILGELLRNLRPLFKSARPQDYYKKLLNKAQRNFCIVQGELHPDVHNEFAEDLEKRLEAEKTRLLPEQRLQVKIISGPVVLTRSGENKMYALYQGNKFPDTLQVVFAKKRPENHYSVVDGKHVYYEEPHSIGETTRRGTIVQNGDRYLFSA